MLEEAELRVKQISNQAVHTGASSLAELDDAMRSANLDHEEIVSIEVETYESTFVFDTLIEEARKKERPTGQASDAGSRRNHIELDPLFGDEE